MNIKYHQGGGDVLRRYKRSFGRNVPKDRRFFAICGLLLILLLIANFANRRLKPIGFELAKAYGSDAVVKIINDSVSEFFENDDVGYSDIVRLRYNTSGVVTSIEYNSAEINRLKLECAEELSKNLGKLKTSKIRVPVGSLFGDVALSGRGPGINVKLSTKAVPSVELMSTLESAGVNQSRHEIIMRVTAQVSVYLPPETAEFTVTQDFVLAQTVIVGEVPQGNLFIE